jgi:long-chain acyl-CoA synthetase
MGARFPVPPRAPHAEEAATVTFRMLPDGRLVGRTVSHGALVAQVSAVHAALQQRGLQFGEQDIYLCFHPLVFLSERTMLLFCLKMGMSVAFSLGEQAELFEELAALHPTLLAGPPSTFTSIHRKYQRIVEGWPAMMRLLFRLACSHKARLSHTGQYQSAVLDPLLFNPTSQMLGGRVRAIMVVGVLDRRVQEWMQVRGARS